VKAAWHIDSRSVAPRYIERPVRPEAISTRTDERRTGASA
jgi:hypothetical protein